VDPREFIGLAHGLIDGTGEGDAPQSTLRTVVNRSYLGALLFSAQVLATYRGAAYARDGTYYHRVEEDLMDIDPGLRERLRSLRRWRVDADYDLTRDLPWRMSTTALEQADRLVREVRQKVL
jgi:hypothetical protein